MGDYERASHSFAAGGHDAMARRLLDMSGQGPISMRPEPMASRTSNEVRRAAGEAFKEIDRGDAFRPASDQRRIPSGTWTATEPGRESGPGGGAGIAISPGVAITPPPSLGAPRQRMPSDLPPFPNSDVPVISSVAPAALISPPRRPMDVARDYLLVFPRDHAVALHVSGLVLVQAQTGFATRLDAVRSLAYAVGWKSAPLTRRMRGRGLEEPLGGPASPLVEITGRGELVLGPSPGHRLVPLGLEDELVYVREDALVGFELGVSYENGRLPVGDGEAIGMVQLRGTGAIVISMGDKAACIEVAEGRSHALRASRVLGWIGRVVPRALPSSEAPAGMRGYVSFAGEGMVLVDER